MVFNLQDVPLGFGIPAQPTAAVQDLDPTASVVLHQADVGEYLRLESHAVLRSMSIVRRQSMPNMKNASHNGATAAPRVAARGRGAF